jgi:carboxymethylenebutenolidase
VLTSADGTQFGAYFAHPNYPAQKSIVILPDVRGLHDFYKDLAVQFAHAGFHAVAIDYFGRTAGVAKRDDDFPWREHVEQLDPAVVDEDTSAAVKWLRGLSDGGNRAVFSVGFCMGGALSWRQSAAGHGLRGCMGFYGIPSRAEDRIAEMASPLLLLAAGQDFTPVEEVQSFAARVRERGITADVRVYEDAPHSFFDRSFDEHEEACADAWHQMLAFAEKYS